MQMCQQFRNTSGIKFYLPVRCAANADILPFIQTFPLIFRLIMKKQHPLFRLVKIAQVLQYSMDCLLQIIRFTVSHKRLNHA